MSAADEATRAALTAAFRRNTAATGKYASPDPEGDAARCVDFLHHTMDGLPYAYNAGTNILDVIVGEKHYLIPLDDLFAALRSGLVNDTVNYAYPVGTEARREQDPCVPRATVAP